MNKRWILLIASTALWAACANDKDDPQPGEEPVDCAALDGEACAQESDCRAIVGARVDEEHACKIADEAVGCIPHDSVCSDAETFARDEDDGLWWFPDLCIPEGWEGAKEGPADYSYKLCGPPEASADCIELSEEGCAERDDCVALNGQPVDRDAKCLEDASFVECVSTTDGCDDTLTLAQDGLHNIWYFTSTCTPEDWTPYAGPDAQELLAAEDCDDNTEPTACQELDESSCDAREDCAGLLAQAVNEDDACLEDSAYVGCRDATQDCADQMLVSRDVDDALWVSPNTCIPEDWQIEDGEDAQEWLAVGDCE